MLLAIRHIYRQHIGINDEHTYQFTRAYPHTTHEYTYFCAFDYLLEYPGKYPGSLPGRNCLNIALLLVNLSQMSPQKHAIKPRLGVVIYLGVTLIDTFLPVHFTYLRIALLWVPLPTHGALDSIQIGRCSTVVNVGGWRLLDEFNKTWFAKVAGVSILVCRCCRITNGKFGGWEKCWKVNDI